MQVTLLKPLDPAIPEGSTLAFLSPWIQPFLSDLHWWIQLLSHSDRTFFFGLR